LICQKASAPTDAVAGYVASLAQAGQLAEARAALDRLKGLQPDMSIAWIKKYVPYTAETMEKFLEGMRKAGLQ
jgi:hypothetical protein